MIKENRKLIWRSVVILALIALLYYAIRLQDQVKIILAAVLLLINAAYLIFILAERRKTKKSQQP